MSLDEQRKQFVSVQTHKAASPEPSCVSMKSDASMDPPLKFNDGTVTSDSDSTVCKMSLDEQRKSLSVQTHKAASPEPSCVSMKSDTSMSFPPDLRDRAVTSDPDAVCKMTLYEQRKEGVSVQKHKVASPESSCVSKKRYRSMNNPTELTDRAVTSYPDLKRDDVIRSVTPHLTCPDSDCQTLVKQRVKDQHKTSMKNKYERLFEGIKLQENQTLLNRIYTQLYIIEGESDGVNEEHEVLQMEKTARTQDTPIYCNDIFKPLIPPGHEEKDQIKTVLTKGIAGIGETVSVQKFILDWAEGKANQDVDFMFVLPFRELNLIKDQQYSFHRLLLDFHPELQDLDSKIYEECKVVFIFDGLDESRITQMFTDDEKVCDVNESSSVGVLMSNLIRGELLPSALFWITSRPAAANQIPSKYINRVTEIQGFNEPQKEEYFRKRISDEHQANIIISHIRRSRTLHIMCHIPVFCLISTTVLQKLLKQDASAEIPQTLTEMYIHFLLTQINMKNQKYDEKDPEKLLKSNRDMIVKLAKLAFNQLMKGNVMFYEEDLIESGIDVTDASVYSGICTEIFKEESVIHQRKVYCFIHLSFQEFLAAFYEFYSHIVKKMKLQKFFQDHQNQLYRQNISLYELLKAAVDKSLQSENGHLDLFLRFLLGISLESNQRLLQDLLTQTVNISETIKNITQYIKVKIKGEEHHSADRCINLFLCLLEMKDQTLYREIQEFVKSENRSVNRLSPSHCSTIAYMLQISEEVLDEFDLKKYNTSDEGRRRLMPAVLNCRKALFADCYLTGQLCESLSSCLQSSISSLRELDLSNNDLQDSGVKLVSDGLKSLHCQLNTLRLTHCNFTAQCCESLSSSLQSSNSSLRELDLSNNDLQDSGVKLLSDGLKSLKCQLNILRLSGCMVTEDGCSCLASALSSNPSHLRELDLSYNNPGKSLVKLLSDPNYRLNKLNLDHAGEIRITTGPQKYACDLTLDLNTANTNLTLSERNRKVTYVKEKQPYPDHPGRFDECLQVLCRQSLSDCCYWEAEWSGNVCISVTYKGINRKVWSNDCRFGYSEKSWSLNCFNDSFNVRHNNKITVICVPSRCSNRVGVYLNWSAGTLSFYSVSDTHTLTHLHTFKSTFTEPLYAGFGFDYGSSVSLCEIKQRPADKPDPHQDVCKMLYIHVLSFHSATSKMSHYEWRKMEEDIKTHRAVSPEPSCVSIKSDRSLPIPPDFSEGIVTSDPEVKRDDVIRSVTPHLTCTDSDCQTLIRQRVKDQHKSSMKNKYERLFEGIKLEENQILLNSIYTQLYIIEGESEGVNEEHEVLQMEKTARTQDTPIYCNDIFKPLIPPGHEEKDQIKTVLTKGIAGIGKTVSVQKFILDWAEGKANQDVVFMFVLPFRELNLIKDQQYNLHRLLLDFHPELQDLDSKIYEECKVVFIFDGLDESRITQMFTDDEKVCDVNKSSSVGVLMSNLIRGKLLPSALIWITSRPAAANQIPSKYINRVTEIQGFNEPQKAEYFRKRISDEHQANIIISHIRRSRSLHIMCHIPVFCWISATVLQKLLKQDASAEIPQTLTEMYIHFLLTQINMKNQKYDEKDPEKFLKSNRDMIVKLAELAFNQLRKGNVMFYEEDLIESGIDITDASVYSGIYTEIFKEESVVHQNKVYCFIHLSFQEFLAAFYLFYSHIVKNDESLELFLKEKYQWYNLKNSLYDLLKAVVDKSLQSENGHLDLFLRFLLGLSLQSNQRLLQNLLTHTMNCSGSIKEIIKYIQDKIKGDERLSADRCINLFLCLFEMKDQTLFREIQEFVKSENHSVNQLSPSHCSTIAYMLQISEEVLYEFDLKKYNTSDEGRRRLLPAAVNCRKALLAGCNLTGQCCESLSSFLQSSNSSLRELDLSNNDLQDSGVKLLSKGLKSSHCQLNILRLAGCNLTGQCCESLPSSLQSPNSSLRDLDLSNNDLQDLGVKLLSGGLKSSHCQLSILRLSGCMVTEKGCYYLASALRSNPSHLRELYLSYNHPGQSLVKLLSNPNYRLEKLNVDHGGEIRIRTGPPKYASELSLDLNTANTHLSLSERNRKVTYAGEKQPYPYHPDRFEWCYQVLCRESLTGRCYWEAEWSGRAVNISVTYKGISRKERSDDSWFGFSAKSWSLNWFIDKFTACHNNKSSVISVPSCDSKRVGVYLNWPAGTLSFYNVSDTHTLTHLHTFNSTFTEPLYAGFGVYYDSSVSLCEIKPLRVRNK
ncbi:uncharacterized protein [Pseudorasbora parva]|uniref:uncharacterized protein n=1 Tax=Pseudorasbora parva TaxID=51549 RepID=UPI00351F24F8